METKDTKENNRKKPNKAEFQGVMAAVTPFSPGNSASRIAMVAHHKTQTVTVLEPDVPRAMTGLESQIPTFDTRLPENAIIISVHKKFIKTIDNTIVGENPLTTIIFQCQDTGMFDTIDVSTYYTNHNVYGVKNVISPIVKNLRPGMKIRPNEVILAHSPSVHEGGIFSDGLMCNIALMSHPGSIEDGFVASESFARRGSLTRLPTVVASFGRKRYPRNLYGDKNHYKFCPDIGETVRADGIIMALTEYDSYYDALEMDSGSLTEVDMVHDIRIYGRPGAIVYDITVESGIGESKSRLMTPPAIAAQAEKYVKSLRTYYTEILNAYDRIIGNNNKPNISYRLNQLIVRAIADQPNISRGKNFIANSGKVRRTYKKIPLDEYRVEIKTSIVEKLEKGSKLSGNHGNKGVICGIQKDSWMPIDKAGNVCDLIMFTKSAIARMNMGQLNEQYICGASRDLTRELRENYNKVPFEVLWERLFGFYKITSESITKAIEENYTHDDKVKHLESVIESGIYLYMLSDSKLLFGDVFKRIEKYAPPVYDKITYTDVGGRRVLTKDKIFIGSQYMIVLEKSDINPMSCSTGYLQAFGMLAGPNKSARENHPSKVQSPRIYSETEGRLYPAIMGSNVIGIMFALANDPDVHKELVRRLMLTPKPSRIVGFNNISINGSRPVKFVLNTLIGFGFNIKDI